MTPPERCACFLLLLLLILSALPAPLFGSSRDREEIEATIASLSSQLGSAESPEKTAQLYCFRARNYVKLKDLELAEQDYRQALRSHYSGWLLNEYGYFLYRCSKYKEAFGVAKRTLAQFPHLRPDAEKLLEKSRRKYQEEYYREHPPTIVMDTPVNPHRVTRHDLIRQLGPRAPVVKQPKPQARKTASAPKPKSKPRRS